MTDSRPSGDRGSATVWVLALSGVLAVLATAVVLVGGATVARHRANTAADLAALAAAGRAVLDQPGACELAAEVAGANAATLDSCSVDASSVVEVRVKVPVRLGRLGVWSAEARARAGPVPSEDQVLLGLDACHLLLRCGCELVQDDVEHPHRARLVQRVVAVAALG